MNIGIIYWSGTGKTAALAEILCEAATSKGHDVHVSSVEDFSEDIKSYDVVLLGCSAQGAEVLEEDVFEPFYETIKEDLVNKKVGLFGSYDWGDGEWMRDWYDDATSNNIDVLGGEGLICQENDDATVDCQNYIDSIL